MKKFFFVIGMISVISGTWMYQVKLENVKFSDSLKITKNQTLHVRQSIMNMSDVLQNVSNCLGCIINGTGAGISTTDIVLNIDVPSELIVNDTTTITLKYNVILNGEKSYDNLPSNIPELNGFFLHSSGFDVTPTAPIVVAQQTRLPLLVVWTVTPKQVGNNVLILNISETLLEQNKNDFLASYYINQNKVTESDLTSIKLPISVYTLWGISASTFEILKLLSILIGSALTYPLLIDFLKPIVLNKTKK